MKVKAIKQKGYKGRFRYRFKHELGCFLSNEDLKELCKRDSTVIVEISSKHQSEDKVKFKKQIEKTVGNNKDLQIFFRQC